MLGAYRRITACYNIAGRKLIKFLLQISVVKWVKFCVFYATPSFKIVEQYKLYNKSSTVQFIKNLIVKPDSLIFLIFF